jgi:alpha,alpha-trehalase
MAWSVRPILLASCCAFTLAATAPAREADAPSAAQQAAVRAYIKDGWTTLSRSTRDLAKAAPDPKFPRPADKPWPVYVPAAEDLARVEAELRTTLSPEDRSKIELRTLPKGVFAGGTTPAPAEAGLLFLPRPYVVPGGRFNEMYGWDSYFIQVGLLKDGEVERARDMVENFLYEIEHYGTILNANRTYYLTRSQPPFLTEMILGVYERTGDEEWLRRTRPAIEKYYAFWTTEPHLIPGTGLSRYYDLGDGPAPEVLSDEKDAQGRTHYDRIREYYRDHPDAAKGDYDVTRYYDRKNDRLTDLFYKGDRSMRESGFDPSNRFGLFNVDVIHYAPVCLNTLLYRMELEAAQIETALGEPVKARAWQNRAQSRKVAIDRYLWDPAAGLYLDYNFESKQRRKYEFATTFYPLWAGLASKEQAARVHANLKLFEAPGGLLTSTHVTGNQWDAPFGWAPLQMLPVSGLRRYGYVKDADRVALKFLALVTKEFGEHGTIVEKYDVQRRESDVEAGIKFGYAANQIGFGWTNAAFLDLLAGLAESKIRRVAEAPWSVPPLSRGDRAATGTAPAGLPLSDAAAPPRLLRLSAGPGRVGGELARDRAPDARPHGSWRWHPPDPSRASAVPR